MPKFEAGDVYHKRSICDSDCIFKFEVISRTEKRIKLKTMEGIVTKKIYQLEEFELVYPLGKYSLCPVIRSNDKKEVNIV